MKISAKTKDCYLLVKVKTSLWEPSRDSYAGNRSASSFASDYESAGLLSDTEETGRLTAPEGRQTGL